MTDLLVTEEPMKGGAHTYIARRRSDNEGNPSWTVFADGRFTPAGFIEQHECEHGAGAGLLLFDTSGLPMFTAKPGRDDGCVPTYRNALVCFEAEANKS